MEVTDKLALQPSKWQFGPLVRELRGLKVKTATMQKGHISVQTENIFPIIKQFLYSDQEIFLRELVSNAVDATTKLKTLSAKGEPTGELGELTIDIVLDEEAKTLTIRDRGIGMTEEEVMKYLNQVAFSSAQDFLDKYKEDAAIIGHFGLGFYSAFMVADKVEVITRSYKEDKADEAIHWICAGDPNYEIGTTERAERGTDVVLHISEDSKEYLKENRIQELLDKYCKFLPVPIRFGTKTERTYAETAEGEEPDNEGTEVTVDNIVNNPHPIWKKQAAELSDDDYREFYRELYPYSQPPMFWIHLNIDFPFNLTGILYFPKLSNNLEQQRNKIQLYSNQVYVTDEVKEIVPEFLTLLHGVIDSPDIPLNVSRSYLQADANVKKITGYITRKVADKLGELFKNDRPNYEEKWSDLGVFVKYGLISEEKFYERASKFLLLQDTEKNYYTTAEYLEKIGDKQTDKYERRVAVYTSDPDGQHSSIDAAAERGFTVLIMDHPIDNPLIQQLEQKEDKLTFVRVDSATPDQLVQTDEEKELLLGEDDQKKVKELFTAVVGDAGTVELKPLDTTDQVVRIVRPEFMRRMKEMQLMQGMDPGMFPDSYQVIVNGNSPVVQQQILDETDETVRQERVDYLYKLALLSQQMLKGKQLTDFMKQSLELLKK